MIKKIIMLCMMLLPVVHNAAVHAETDVYIGIQARGTHVSLGLAQFLPKNYSVRESALSRLVESVIRYDLLFSLYFDLVEGGPVSSMMRQIDFEGWKKLGADALVAGECEFAGDTLRINVGLYDIETGELIWQQVFESDSGKMRSSAHAVSDEITLRFTGEKGIARTKIAFSNNASGNKEIYVVDYDGYNLTRITRHKSISLFPRWSKDGKKICYTSYKDKNPDLFIMNANGSDEKPLSIRQGLNTAARWSPNGDNLALTLSMGKDPNIFIINEHGEIIRRVTKDQSAETSPDFSPNGQHMVYTSDLPGYPQLYISDVYGRNARRLLSGDYCDSPAWSPQGDKITYTMMTGGRYFDIYTVDIFGRRQVRLTFNSNNNENPSWSPDGRFIIFTSKRNGKTELFIMSADGTNQHRLLELKGESFTPDWSPYLGASPHL
ncbi:MAG: hypothetical protein ABII23_08680 [bacterium]